MAPIRTPNNNITTIRTTTSTVFAQCEVANNILGRSVKATDAWNKDAT
jgi:hypothetical protein